MSNQTLNLTESLHRYLLAVSLRESEELRQLRQEMATHAMGQMQIAPEQGQFMAWLLQLMGATRVLEIGVFTGYSSLWMASVLPENGRIIACDVSEEYTAIARKYWLLANVNHKIDLRIAPALDTLDALLANGQANTIDFAFIDADKSNYQNYYERSLQLVRPGGVIAIDNVLWSGRVADSADMQKRTETIRALNQSLHADDRVHLSVLPIADGLSLALKR
ncbi:MAG: SAM-dependent methyltransferase [Cyanothece sp. SIO2G6]|nr:SAM-dependent methyltransferase [Cyanothece sp. SIO2G6]